MMQGLGVDFVKTASLGSLRKVQLKVEKSYDRKSLRPRTRLDLEQLLFNTPILVTPKTWCKNITNKFLLIFGSITAKHERCSSLENTHQQIFLREHTRYCFGSFYFVSILICMQDVLSDLTWQSSQKSKLVLVARLLFVSPYNI
jgi:hypothetical protein